MGSKLTLLLGLLVGAFLTLMCVNENKTALSLKHNQIVQNDTTLETIPPASETATQKVVAPEKAVQESPKEKEVVVKLDDPSFSYTLKDHMVLNGHFSQEDNNSQIEEFITKYCPDDTCTKNVTFDKKTKNAPWQKDALKIAAFLKEHDVKDGAISIDSTMLNIEGELQNDEDMNQLNQLLKPFDPEQVKVENITTVKTVKEEIQPVTTVEEEKPSLEQTQEEISSMLKTNPIYFKFNSSIITQDSKKVLDNILEVLDKVDDINLVVEGHTDASGNANYNKQLSQKRAEAVKEYLLSHSNKHREIEAIGYGEERPISNNPREKINRRVEIHLKRGE